MPNKIQHNRKLWKKRPPSQELINYAVDDVSQLLNLADKLTVELGKSQLQLLARLSQKYSQMFWLPADRTKPRGSETHEVASMVGLYFHFTQGSSLTGSWLTRLFLSDKGDDAAYRAKTSSEEEEEEEQEEDMYNSEKEAYNKSYHYSSSEEEVSSNVDDLDD